MIRRKPAAKTPLKKKKKKEVTKQQRSPVIFFLLACARQENPQTNAQPLFSAPLSTPVCRIQECGFWPVNRYVALSDVDA
jgi:hypothetical protein